jgi:hypothetical protein
VTAPTANPTVVGNAANVLVGHVQVYIAPVGTAAPATSVPYGTAWPVAWVATGYTEKGLTVTMDRKSNNIFVEEIPEPVQVTTDTNLPTLEIEFAEDTLQSMIWAYGGGTIVVSGSGATQTATLNLAETLTEVAIGFEGSAPFGNFRRVIVPVVIATGKVKTTYMRAKSARSYPCTFTSVGPLTAWSIVELGAGTETQ